jgi:hypothetical protein
MVHTSKDGLYLVFLSSTEELKDVELKKYHEGTEKHSSFFVGTFNHSVKPMALKRLETLLSIFESKVKICSIRNYFLVVSEGDANMSTVYHYTKSYFNVGSLDIKVLWQK